MERLIYHKVGDAYCTPFVPLVKDAFALLRPARIAISKRAKLLHPLTQDQFLETCSGRRKQVYTEAAARLAVTGLLPRHSAVQAFVKAEKMLDQPKKLVPRIIQPRRPEYNIKVGCYLKAVEHLIYAIIDNMFGKHEVVMKGRNATQRGQALRAAWRRFRHPVAICLDASRFDQHVNIALLIWEHLIWCLFFGGDHATELHQLLRYQLFTKGTIHTPDGTLRYDLKGGRCSGDMNTSSGNVLLMSAAVYCFLKWAGIDPKQVAFIDDGDDCLIICESEMLGFETLIPTYFGQLGLVMKVEPPVFIFERIEFCQAHPLIMGDECRMVRTFPDVCSKDATIIKPVTGEVLPGYLAAIGDCGLSLSSGVPIMQEYYKAMKRWSSGAKSLSDPSLETGMSWLAKGMASVEAPVLPETRVSFYHAFGVLPDVQEFYERLLSQTKLDAIKSPDWVAPVIRID